MRVLICSQVTTPSPSRKWTTLAQWFAERNWKERRRHLWSYCKYICHALPYIWEVVPMLCRPPSPQLAWRPFEEPSMWTEHTKISVATPVMSGFKMKASLHPYSALCEEVEPAWQQQGFLLVVLLDLNPSHPWYAAVQAVIPLHFSLCIAFRSGMLSDVGMGSNEIERILSPHKESDQRPLTAPFKSSTWTGKWLDITR